MFASSTIKTKFIVLYSNEKNNMIKMNFYRINLFSKFANADLLWQLSYNYFESRYKKFKYIDTQYYFTCKKYKVEEIDVTCI